MTTLFLIASLQGIMLSIYWFKNKQALLSGWTALAALQLLLMASYPTSIGQFVFSYFFAYINLDLFYGPILLAWFCRLHQRNYSALKHLGLLAAVQCLSIAEVMLNWQLIIASHWLTLTQILAYVLYVSWLWWRSDSRQIWQGSFILSLAIMWAVAMAVASIPANKEFWVPMSFVPVSLWIFSWGWLLILLPNLMSDQSSVSKKKYKKQTLPDSINDPLLKALRDHILAKKYRDWSGRVDVAKALMLSEEQTSQWLNDYIKISLSDLLALLRIADVASEIIQQNQQSFLQLATDAGFGNKVSFNQAFKKYFQCTPTEFKKRSNIEQKQALIDVLTVNSIGISDLPDIFLQSECELPAA